jgi:hypothetical protein
VVKAEFNQDKYNGHVIIESQMQKKPTFSNFKNGVFISDLDAREC